MSFRRRALSFSRVGIIAYPCAFAVFLSWLANV